MNLIDGLLVGGIYGLVGVAFVLIYKTSKILNLAQGSLVLIGAYVSYMFITQIGLPIWLGIPSTLVVAILIALGIERFPLRPLIGQPILAIIMVTIGLDILIRGACTLIWGVKGWRIYPQIFPITPIKISTFSISREHLCAFLISIFLVVILSLFFKKTMTGLLLRAAAEGHKVSQSMGIRVTKIIAISWALSAVISGFGGIFLGSIHNVNVPLADVGLKALPAALVGGLDSIHGAVIGGILIGISESLGAAYIGHGFREISAYIVLILVLFIKPYGLFGLERIERV